MNPEVVREYFRYCPETGEVYWKKSPATSIPEGSLAGGKDSRGYMKVQLKGRQLYLHRIVFILMGEHLPKGSQVDHINGDKSDNRWSNLRIATARQNCANRKPPENKTSGVVGVCWDKRKRKWRAYCRHKHLGYFDCPVEAGDVYEKVSKEMYGEFKFEI